MTMANARVMLQRTLTRFKQVTGQRVGVVYKWEGGLSVFRNSLFTDLINEHTSEVWESLACPNITSSIPAQEFEMAASIKGDLKKLNVMSLRRMISWITQKSVGRFKAFRWEYSTRTLDSSLSI